MLGHVTTPNVPATSRPPGHLAAAQPVVGARHRRPGRRRVFIDRNHDGLYTAGVDTRCWPTTTADGRDDADSDGAALPNAGSVGMNLERDPYVGIESMSLCCN